MARARQSSPPIPGWGMLVIGLAIGLFIAFLVYLNRLGEPGTKREQASAATSAEQPRVKPEFEFYSILPELEVVIPDVPESEALIGKPRKSEQNGHTVYYLQAGSFKSTAEADRMKANLLLLGLDVTIQSVAVNNVRWHRVRVGPLTDARQLRDARARLLDADIDFMLLKTES